MLANVLERCARQDTWEALVMLARGSLKLGKKKHWGGPTSTRPFATRQSTLHVQYLPYAPRVSLFRIEAS
jgi:hypothetical protein